MRLKKTRKASRVGTYLHSFDRCSGQTFSVCDNCFCAFVAVLFISRLFCDLQGVFIYYVFVRFLVFVERFPTWRIESRGSHSGLQGQWMLIPHLPTILCPSQLLHVNHSNMTYSLTRHLALNLMTSFNEHQYGFHGHNLLMTFTLIWKRMREQTRYSEILQNIRAVFLAH